MTQRVGEVRTETVCRVVRPPLRGNGGGGCDALGAWRARQPGARVGTRFVKPAKGLTLMLGLTPRHSCHPISHTGRGASARETSGRIACNRTCVCVRLATD